MATSQVLSAGTRIVILAKLTLISYCKGRKISQKKLKSWQMTLFASTLISSLNIFVFIIAVFSTKYTSRGIIQSVFGTVSCCVAEWVESVYYCECVNIPPSHMCRHTQQYNDLLIHAPVLTGVSHYDVTMSSWADTILVLFFFYSYPVDCVRWVRHCRKLIRSLTCLSGQTFLNNKSNSSYRLRSKCEPMNTKTQKSSASVCFKHIGCIYMLTGHLQLIVNS